MVSATDVAMTEDGREFGTGNGESRLTLKAKAPVWVRIEDAQGNVVMTQMLMKGDTYRVPTARAWLSSPAMAACWPMSSTARKRAFLARPAKSSSAVRSISSPLAATADHAQVLRAVVQRVSEASVTVDGLITGAIGRGFLVLICAMAGDTEKQAETLARKIANLRIFQG